MTAPKKFEVTDQLVARLTDCVAPHVSNKPATSPIAARCRARNS
jgi:hypothetical protein